MNDDWPYDDDFDMPNLDDYNDDWDDWDEDEYYDALAEQTQDEEDYFLEARFETCNIYDCE